MVLSQARFVVLDRWLLVGPPSLKFFSKTPVECKPVPKQENNIFRVWRLNTHSKALFYDEFSRIRQWRVSLRSVIKLERGLT